LPGGSATRCDHRGSPENATPISTKLISAERPSS
jgi:hypothetical protein